MTPANLLLTTNLTRRIAHLHDLFDESGDDRWLVAADKSEAALLRLRQRVES